MSTQNIAVDVRVRNTFNTYTATCKGRLTTPTAGGFPALRASCTAGAEQAVRALALKIFHHGDASVQFVRRDGVLEIWRISA